MIQRGKFIVFEGIDGAGKSSYLSTAQEVLSKAGHDPIMTREPGGTALGEKLRELLLHDAMAPETECLLMFAARQQHISEVIEPALAQGRWVLCDRFTDATYAYQGAGRGFGQVKIEQMESWVQGKFRPDFTLVFDLNPTEAARRRSAARSADRFELLDEAFFSRVRNAYLDAARRKPHQYAVINTEQSVESVKALVEKTIVTLC